MPNMRKGLALTLALCALATVAGFVLKASCIGYYNERRNTHFCVNDFQILYINRGLEAQTFPYVSGSYDQGVLSGGTIEYPVLTGLIAWVPSLVADNDGKYLIATSALLAPFSFLAAWLLFLLSRRRALLYATAPPLVWYSFQNWDLPVLAATVAAFYLWHRGRWGWSAALLAVGAGLKLWPGFFLLALLLHRLRAGDRRGAAAVVTSAVGVTALINAPFALINAEGWFAPYAFQRDRPADITSNSIWFWGLPRLSTETLNELIPMLLLLAFAAAAGFGWWRSRREEGAYPFIQVCGAMLCAFMLLNKAHSPQFTLWLLPFFVLLQVRWGWYVGYFVMDALLFFGLFSWYEDLGQGQDFGIAKQATILGVWGRAAMLAMLFVIFLRARTAVDLPGRDLDQLDQGGLPQRDLARIPA